MSWTGSNRRWRHALLWGALGLFLLAFWFAQRTPANEVEWLDRYEAAKERARQQQRPMLLYFTADWCPPCQAMKRDTWPNARVERMVNERFVPVYVDVDEQANLPISERFAVQAIPTLYATDASGEPLTDASGQPVRHSGYLSTEQMLAFLRFALDRADEAG
jgi:thioredoxin-related protein